MHCSGRSVAGNRNLVGVPGRQRFDGLDNIGDQWRKRE
jgi:hypothetical protein